LRVLWEAASHLTARRGGNDRLPLVALRAFRDPGWT
jgi:hypothetical protein